MAKPNISFTLTNNDNVIVKTSGSNDLLKTIHEIYGVSTSSKMIKIKNMNDDFINKIKKETKKGKSLKEYVLYKKEILKIYF